MGRCFHIALEYDGENPIRNTFLCDVDDLYYSDLRYWEDLYDSDLNRYGNKKCSLSMAETACYTWGIDNIAKKIKMVKREIKLDIDLDKQGKKNLKKIIADLQMLHDIAMKKCNENNIDPEKCYIKWWIN